VNPDTRDAWVAGAEKSIEVTSRRSKVLVDEPADPDVRLTRSGGSSNVSFSSIGGWPPTVTSPVNGSSIRIRRTGDPF
jgi:hypothetical protein